MLYEIIGFTSHCCGRISYKPFAVIRFGQSCQKVDFPVQKLLIKLVIAAIYILILPACILGKLSVILISVTALDYAVLSTLLKNLIFIVPHTNNGRLLSRHGLRQHGNPYEKQNRKNTFHKKPPPLLLYCILFYSIT